jgi:hypothetical protein
MGTEGSSKIQNPQGSGLPEHLVFKPSLIPGFMQRSSVPDLLLPCCIALQAKFVFASLDMTCSRGATLESSFVRGLQAAFHHGGPQAEAVVEAGGIEALIDALHRGAGCSQLQQAVRSFFAEE